MTKKMGSSCDNCSLQGLDILALGLAASVLSNLGKKLFHLDTTLRQETSSHETKQKKL
jgi:hypothetical protein